MNKYKREEGGNYRNLIKIIVVLILAIQSEP